jgi:hypothetical protein
MRENSLRFQWLGLQRGGQNVFQNRISTFFSSHPKSHVVTSCMGQFAAQLCPRDIRNNQNLAIHFRAPTAIPRVPLQLFVVDNDQVYCERRRGRSSTYESSHCTSTPRPAYTSRRPHSVRAQLLNREHACLWYWRTPSHRHRVAPSQWSHRAQLDIEGKAANGPYRRSQQFNTRTQFQDNLKVEVTFVPCQNLL